MRTKILATVMTCAAAAALAFVMTAAAVVTPATLLTVQAGASATRSAANPSGNVAFLRGGSLDVIHADGAFPGEVMHVTPSGTSVWAYAWSPNAERIAYIDAYDGSLWLASPDGTGRRRLLAGSRLASSELSWSPDGKKIAITSSGPYTKKATGCRGLRIYIVPIHASHPSMLRRASADCSGLAWSPRGNEIAYGGSGTYGGGRIWVVHPDGSGRRPVLRRGAGWVNWSADGEQIAFAIGVHVHQGSGTEPGIYRGIGVVDANGRDFHIVTRHADNEYPAVWSPKGHRLLYGRANNGGIYVIGSNGRNDHRVTPDSPLGSEEPKLAWSPDGGSIVYAASTGGLYEVGVDGHGEVQLTTPPNGDQDPSWVAGAWAWG